jgi:hypothetical protein
MKRNEMGWQEAGWLGGHESSMESNGMERRGDRIEWKAVRDKHKYLLRSNLFFVLKHARPSGCIVNV